MLAGEARTPGSAVQQVQVPVPAQRADVSWRSVDDLPDDMPERRDRWPDADLSGTC